MTQYLVGGLQLPRPFRVRRIGHVGYHSPDVNATAQFLAQSLGLQQSDVDDFTSRVPQLPQKDATGYFFRCGTDHHTVVVGSQALVDTREPARRGALVGQISWQVGSLKEVVDGIAFLDESARLRRVGRDAPGSNWHAYAYDPDGYINEIFYGMEQIGWDGRSKPKSMYDRAFHEAPDLPQMAEVQEVDVAIARGGDANGFRVAAHEPMTYDVDGILMARPFKLTRLARIQLFVADLEKSLDFYTRVLGLRVTQRKPVLGHECAFLRADCEHHTLALVPKALQEALGFGAGYGLAVATYQQLRDAYAYLRQQGVRMLDVPAQLSPGVRYGFWVQGPDRLAIQIFYGMEAVHQTGALDAQAGLTVHPAQWPQSIRHGDAAWFDPVFYGPLA